MVEEGCQEIVDLLAEFNGITDKFSEPDADFEKLCDRQAVLQEKLDHMDAWDLDSRLELAMDALRCLMAIPRSTFCQVVKGDGLPSAACC